MGKCRPITITTINGKEKFASIKDATEEFYNHPFKYFGTRSLKCCKCGKKLTYSSIQHRIQRNQSLINPVCGSCVSSELLTESNKSIKRRKEVSEQSKKLWQDKKFKEKHHKKLLEMWEDDAYRKSQMKRLKKLANSPMHILILEVCRQDVDKNKKTYLYYCESDKYSNKYKFGITNCIDNRNGHHGDGGYSNYNIIKSFKNRYNCALCEYFIKQHFNINNEYINKGDLNELQKFVKSFKPSEHINIIKPYM